MDPEIIPIIEPNIHWHELLDNFSELAGKKLTAADDLSPIDLEEPAQALVALYSIRAMPSDPLNVLRSCLPFVGQYLSYAFLVVASKETLQILQAYTQLDILHTEAKEFNVGVISAHLQSWHTAITHCTSQVNDRETRLIFNKIMLWFEEKGLGNIFDRWVKIDMGDDSFKLEVKK